MDEADVKQTSFELTHSLTREGEYQRLAMVHGDMGDEYAARSHEFEGEISDHYSALAEAHRALSAGFSRLTGGTPPEDAD